MLSPDFIRSISRADVDGFDDLAAPVVNKKLLDELRVCSTRVTQSDDGTIWHQEAAENSVFYFVSRRSPEAMCLYLPYREIILMPGLHAIEVSCWQSSVTGAFSIGWQEARDEVFGRLLNRSSLVASSDSLNRSGGRFWEDRVGQHIIAGGRGGIAQDGVLSYAEHWSWFAPEYVGRNGSSRFFLRWPGSEHETR